MNECESLVRRALESFQSDNPIETEKSLRIAALMVISADAAEHPHDEVFMERAASAVHDAWLSRNKAHASETQLRPYPELPEAEKDKDRRYVRAVLEVFRSGKED